ncbi:Latex clearing protein precursor [compost metagenome]
MSDLQSVLNRDAILQRFGAEKLDLLLEMSLCGDPLADALVVEQRANPQVNGAAARGIVNGLASLERPAPALREWLEQAESVPAWMDAERIRKGVDAYLSIGLEWLTISLGPGSLAHTYSSPAIARVLMATGNLDQRADRRLLETAMWNHQVARPGGLAIGAPGYVHSLQVRLLHARVRSGLLEKGWPVATLGMPINQIDMARTWLDFTYVPLNSLQKVGIDFSDEEFADLYHLWQFIAHLLGIDPRLYRLAHDQRSGAELLALIDASIAPPDESSRQLTAKMLDALGRRLHQGLQMAEEDAVMLMHSVCRLFHGDELAGQLGAEENWTVAMLPAMAERNRAQRQQERLDPELRRQKIEKTLQAFDQADGAMQGDTAYQGNLSVEAAAV